MPFSTATPNSAMKPTAGRDAERHAAQPQRRMPPVAANGTLMKISERQAHAAEGQIQQQRRSAPGPAAPRSSAAPARSEVLELAAPVDAIAGRQLTLSAPLLASATKLPMSRPRTLALTMTPPLPFSRLICAGPVARADVGQLGSGTMRSPVGVAAEPDRPIASSGRPRSANAPRWRSGIALDHRARPCVPPSASTDVEHVATVDAVAAIALAVHVDRGGPAAGICSTLTSAAPGIRSQRRARSRPPSAAACRGRRRRA